MREDGRRTRGSESIISWELIIRDYIKNPGQELRDYRKKIYIKESCCVRANKRFVMQMHFRYINAPTIILFFTCDLFSEICVRVLCRGSIPRNIYMYYVCDLIDYREISPTGKAI